MFSPYINRFIQPDTLIPSPANPQAWNRYSYVLNSPVNFNDPTGHMCSDPEDPTPTCDGSGGNPPNNPPVPNNGGGNGDEEDDDLGDESPFPPSATLQDRPLEGLGTPYENQGNTNFCGAYSISMARSLYYQACSSSTGADVADEIWWNSMLNMGIPPAFYEGYIHNNIPEAVLEHYNYATMTDLKQAISHDKIVIVAISYDSTHDILFKPIKDLTIGHYMIAVGYDENSIHLLNPASRNPGIDTWANKKFTELWQNNDSFIIPSGTMFTISHP